jgi:Domain of unknown function (DUF5664)
MPTKTRPPLEPHPNKKLRDLMATSPRWSLPEKEPKVDGFKLSTAALPTDSASRKLLPIFWGVLAYFPAAFAAIADVSRVGNDKHNPGQPLHWARGKGGNNLDEALRHLAESVADKFDVDGQRHLAKAAWRINAALQLEIEEDAALGIPMTKTPGITYDD